MENELYQIISQKPHLFVIGNKNQGKTRTIRKLIQQLSARGYRIAAWKHSPHSHPIDKPESDSDQFRKSGASVSIFQSLDGTGFYLPSNESELQIQMIRSIIEMVDILLIESFASAPGPKIQVYRNQTPHILPDFVIATVGPTPIYADIPNFREIDSELVRFLEKFWFGNTPP